VTDAIRPNTDFQQYFLRLSYVICPKYDNIFRTKVLTTPAFQPKETAKHHTLFLMSELKNKIFSLISTAGSGHAWVPNDFAAFGSRNAIDKTLQRMVQSGDLRRIERGLYDRPNINSLTKRSTVPDYRAVLDAIARRDQLRMLVDGMTAANDLGLTNAVPARVTIHTDARRKSIALDNLVIEFRQTAPSRLYWAGRPAMRVVQALHWLKDTLSTDRERVLERLKSVMADPMHGNSICDDLLAGFGTLPTWMQDFVRELPGCAPKLPRTSSQQTNANKKRPDNRRRMMETAS
jgi:hypothetical protein